MYEILRSEFEKKKDGLSREIITESDRRRVSEHNSLSLVSNVFLSDFSKRCFSLRLSEGKVQRFRVLLEYVEKINFLQLCTN